MGMVLNRMPDSTKFPLYLFEGPLSAVKKTENTVLRIDIDDPNVKDAAQISDDNTFVRRRIYVFKCG